MKKTVLSFILSLACACGVVLGSGVVNAPAMEAPRAAAEAEATPATERVDYAGQAVLDRHSGSQLVEATVKTFIDGDTTHFYVDDWGTDGVFKARYAAVNTPESTGDIEPWGKKASNYTKNALSTATSIVLESDTDQWKPDSTGTRYMTWVWYKAPGSDIYRNLNLELLQKGLGIGSKAGDSRYGSLATPAIAQAVALKLNVHSTDPDPDFFYGDSIELDLKGLRLNIAQYNGKRVAFEGVVSYYVDQGVYVENYDEETAMYYGIYVYYGFNFKEGAQLLAIGNRVRISGVVGEFNGSYQVSSLKYNGFFPSADDVRLISKGHAAARVETSATTFNSTVPIVTETVDPETEEVTTTTKNYKYADLALNTSISMKGLLVKSAYTTDNGGDNDGAMTLTCQADGKTVTVRTIVLRDSQGNIATQDMLVGKTIDVTGVVDSFNGEYQIKILSTGGIKVDGQPLFPPVEKPVTPPTDSSSGSSSEELKQGCGSIVAVSAIAPLTAAAFVMMKKRED